VRVKAGGYHSEERGWCGDARPRARKISNGNNKETKVGQGNSKRDLKKTFVPSRKIFLRSRVNTTKTRKSSTGEEKGKISLEQAITGGGNFQRWDNERKWGEKKKKKKCSLCGIG